MAILAQLRERLSRVALRISILDRVLIGNSVIIIFGAVAGTILTRHLTILGNVRLILLFSTIGILITLLVNRLIIQTALDPLHKLGDALELVHSRKIDIPDSVKNYQDPDIRRLVIAINSMLIRIANYTNQLQAISKRAINAQEEERVRIARSLHDDTAQSISMLIIHLERLNNIIPDERADITRYITDAQNVATRLLENLRKVIWDLRPSILDDLGLVSAIRWFARTNLEDAGINVDLSVRNEITRLPPYLETMLFRITQETISNILRHANASKVSIRLWMADERIWLEIKDDGCGFDLQKTVDQAISHQQLGLLGIRERASLVHGEVRIESSKDRGTCVQVYIPVPTDIPANAGPDGSNVPEGMVHS